MNYAGILGCGFCGNTVGPLRWCGACRSISYCNRDHQKQHWPVHKNLCCGDKIQKEISQEVTIPDSTNLDLPASFLNSVFGSEELNLQSLEDPSYIDSLSAPVSNMGIESNVYQKRPSLSLYDLNSAQGICELHPDWLTNVTELLLRDLNQFGFSAIDNFLGIQQADDVLNEVHQLHSGGVLTDGQVVSQRGINSKSVRGDQITWISGFEKGCGAIIKLVSTINAVVAFANQHENAGQLRRYSIGHRTSAMVACYPGHGTRYVKHVDNPDGDGRCITAIYYMNKNWKAEDGGVLQIYPRDSNQIAEIEPLFDRMLFFWSDRRNPHEVLPSTNTRYAITVWYFDQKERETYHQRCRQKTSNSAL